jgi:hypothetical protein
MIEFSIRSEEGKKKELTVSVQEDKVIFSFFDHEKNEKTDFKLLQKEFESVVEYIDSQFANQESD